MFSKNPETGTIRLSVSKIRTFMDCPLQAKFQYLDLLPRKKNAYAVFGNCIHYALQQYNLTADLNTCLKTFLDVWDHPDKLGETVEVWPRGTSYGAFRDRGLGMLRGYHDKCRWERRKVLATERSFVVPFGDFEFVGVVDLVELRRNSKGKWEVRVVDYKTNKKQPWSNSLKLDIQFTAYIYAVLQKEFWVGFGEEIEPIEFGEAYYSNNIQGGPPPRAFWYHLETNKEIDVGPRDDADFMRLYRAASEIVKAAEHNVFVPNISGDSCVWCPYTKPCGLPVLNSGGDD